MTIEDIERVKKAVIRRYPIAAGLALSNLEIELSDSVNTAAVVGKKNDEGILEVDKIVVNPEFFDNLTFSERVFVLAHESLHIALKHFSRALSKPEADARTKYKEYCEIEKDEEKRKIKEIELHNKYHRIWNIATDACINAFLKRDGFDFPDDVVDPKTGAKMQFVEMEEGLVKSAEKIYEYLVQKEEEKEKQNKGQDQQQQEQGQSQDGQNQQQSQSNQSSSSNKNSLDDVDVDNYQGIDSHEEWTGDPNENNSEKENDSSQTSDSSEEENVDEIEVFKREMRNRANEEESSKNDSVKSALSNIRSKNGIGNYTPTKPIISWKRLLIGIEEQKKEVWGTRRSSKFNPNARIEERTVEGRPSVEVVLDVSGSISPILLRGFLLQLYQILEAVYVDSEVSMKVGAFSEFFSGFEEIKTKDDIAKYSPSIGGGTDFEQAVTAFTPDPGRKITKIVFTDGVLGWNPTTRVPDIIWVVFGNQMDFTPLGGRIIKVSEEDYKEMINGNSMHMTIEDDHSFSK